MTKIDVDYYPSTDGRVTKTRMRTERLTLRCRRCGEGDMEALMQGSSAWMHRCIKCRAHEWQHQKFPRIVYAVEDAAE